MRVIQKDKLYGTTDGSGDLTVTSDNEMLGGVYAVEWIDGDFADGVDLTLSYTSSDEGVSRNILVVADANADKIYYPRVLEHLDTDGSALTTHALPLVNGKLKMVVANGGDTKTGGCVVHVAVS